MFWPCFYTALTTIVAFGSLLLSDIKPIIDFGTIMIFSLIIIFITSFSILPGIIYYFPNINKSELSKISLLEKFVDISTKYVKTIIIANLIIFSLSMWGIYKLNVENSFINYFKSSTQIYKGMKIIDSELGGTTPLDIIIKFKDYEQILTINNQIDEDLDFLNSDEELIDIGDDLFLDDKINNDWLSNEKIEIIKKIHNYLESRSEIGNVQSIYTLIKVANLINKKELNNFELSILYSEIPNSYKIRLINPFFSEKENMIKINARIKDSNDIQRDKLINEINYFIKTEIKNIKSFEVNGLLVLYNNMLQSLFSSQIKSFGFILISIFMMFLILFQSLKLSIIAMIPNIMASSFILGLIGLLKIPLDIMTITIAAITIGIAVDNTIHYIYSYKENNNDLDSAKKIIKKTHYSVGKAVLTTSMTIAFGFSVLSLSNFIPTILFGIFTSLAMIAAMLGVLITLPAIFMYKE